MYRYPIVRENLRAKYYLSASLAVGLIQQPLITREEYTADASRAFLDRNYGGSFARMFAALSGGEQIDKEEIRELRRKLEEWEKQ